MSTVEAAASLFGADDPAADPFATLGADTTSPSANDDLLENPGQPDVSQIFDTIPDSSNLFDAEVPSVQEVSQFPSEPTTHDVYSYDSSAYSQSSNTSYSNDVPAQVLYDEHSQWPSNGQPVMQHSSSAYSNTSSLAQSSSYDPYAPKQDYTTSQSSTNSQSPYNAYVASSQSSTPYTTSSTLNPPQPPYSPYSPSTTTSQLGSSYPSAIQTPYGASLERTAVAPPPPPTGSAINRPKVYNAYDPPFPTTKASKRGARHGAVVAAQQQYSAYDAYAQPTSPPPPPPPPARSPSIGTYGSPTYSQSSRLPDVYSQTADGSIETAHDSWNNGTPSSVPIGQITDAYGSYGPDPGYPLSKTGNVISEAVSSSGYASASASPYQPFSAISNDHSQRDVISSDLSSQSTNGTSSPSHVYDPHVYTSPSLPAATESDTRASPPYNSSANGESDIPSNASYSTSDFAGGEDVPIPYSPNFKSPPLQAYAFSSNSIASQFTARASSPGSLSLHSPSSKEIRPSAPPRRNTNTYVPHTSVERSSSPSLNRGSKSPLPQVTATDSYPRTSYESDRVSSPAASVRSVNGSGSRADPYTPNIPQYGVNGYEPPALDRTSSPGSFSIRSNGSQASQYAPPPKNSYGRPTRSMSNSSAFSSASLGPEDNYAPSHPGRQQPSETSDYGSYTSRYNYSGIQENSSYVKAYDIPASQELTVTKSPRAPYAPSPSLLGSNDPLGRTAARVPIFSFGCGGKLVTCFHGASSLNTGFDVALSSRNSTGIHIRVLDQLIPDSALNSSAASFPGPLFADPGTPTTSLVRTGVAAQTKTKKTRVVTYLGEREDEISRGISYLHVGTADRRQAEGKLVLVRLLKVMVENDGRLTGTPQIDKAVRSALVPRLYTSIDGLPNDSSVASPPMGFSSLADTHSPMSDLAAVPYPGLPRQNTESSETPIAVSTLRPSALQKIQEFLLRGERRQAYHYALDERLWAHAMVIASSIDKEAWKEAVNDFLKTELGVKDDATSRPTHLRATGGIPASAVNGREGLRAAYSLFSGQGAAAVQELVPQNLLARATGLAAPVSHLTPMTPNFQAPSSSVSIPVETLSGWAETTAMMLSSPLTLETSSALTALGDQLLSNQWIEAAHACYLLAPQTSPMGGVGNPTARIVLLGSRSPQIWPGFYKDPDPFIFSEIVEFALSLSPTPKGQDVFNGLPHLQVYRLVRAASLAEIGQVQLANRYCEAINASSNRPSPYLTEVFFEQLKGLTDRLVGAPHVDKPGSWIGGKLSKPSLDTIGGWLEGRFTKLVTGDSDSATPPEEESIKPEERAFMGPFSHYSTISSATPSARSSPQPSVINLNVLPPPRRTGSAMAPSPPPSHVQIDRASSAMDYIRRKPSPVPRISSAGATTTSFSQSPSFGQAMSDYPANNNYGSFQDEMTPRPALDGNDHGQDATWWGSSSYGEGSAAQTPTASTFLHVDENAVPSSSNGFISLMDQASYTVTPQTSSPAGRHQFDDEDEEDLGFGNSKRDRPSKSGDGEQKSAVPQKTEEPKAAVPDRPELKTASNGSWISRWWKRSDSTTPGPIKASLGEETSFYYDKDLKRWVNKKAGSDEPAKPAPPPPPRAQTASPGMTGSRPPPSAHAGPPTGPPPPARAASAIDLSSSPPNRSGMRVRSNLVPSPSPGTESAPNTPTGSRLAPSGPPPGRPKSQASKRNIRSRYVDVFQEGAPA